MCEECLCVCGRAEMLSLLLRCKLCAISLQTVGVCLSFKVERMNLTISPGGQLIDFVYAILMTNSHVKRVQGCF